MGVEVAAKAGCVARVATLAVLLTIGVAASVAVIREIDASVFIGDVTVKVIGGNSLQLVNMEMNSKTVTICMSFCII